MKHAVRSVWIPSAWRGDSLIEQNSLDLHVSTEKVMFVFVVGGFFGHEIFCIIQRPESSTGSWKTFPSVDDVLVDGVRRGEAEYERSKCNHGDTEDHQPVPAVKESKYIRLSMDNLFCNNDSESCGSNVKRLKNL